MGEAQHRRHVEHHHRPRAQARGVCHQEPVCRVRRARREEDRNGDGRAAGEFRDRRWEMDPNECQKKHSLLSLNNNFS